MWTQLEPRRENLLTSAGTVRPWVRDEGQRGREVGSLVLGSTQFNNQTFLRGWTKDIEETLWLDPLWSCQRRKRKPGDLGWTEERGGLSASRHCVRFNWPSGMQAGVSIGLTGSPGIWEQWRERGHVTSTHHQLYQILLAQLSGSGIISQFPKAPGEISCSLGPSSKRTGDRFKGWSGLLGSDKEQKLKPLRTPTHITSDEINLPD